MIPPFREDGSLPPGIHWASWEEKYLGELLPEFPDEPEFLEYFQTDRFNNRKGIVALELRDWT